MMSFVLHERFSFILFSFHLYLLEIIIITLDFLELTK